MGGLIFAKFSAFWGLVGASPSFRSKVVGYSNFRGRWSQIGQKRHWRHGLVTL